MKKRTIAELAAEIVAKVKAMVRAKLKFAKGTKKEVQEALQVTWVLRGILKRAQLTYLYTGKMLTQVKEQGMYKHLNHEDMEDYAQKRLGLGKTSLYKYLKVYDWVLNNHPEWLQPKPKGFIPDLSDIADLIWIEDELKRTNLTPDLRKALEELQKKALDGELRKGEVDPYRRRTRPDKDSLRFFLAKLRRLRREGAALKNLPDGVISDLDSAIGRMVDKK